ncbi:MAG: dienelactone hydrolase family protein [Chitinophagaceae bacterium]|nr:MAG: dienelactone hydrolase family protein [Chitinophagaceae bacterium]
MPQLIKGYVPLTVQDGTTMQVYAAYPSGGDNLPGMIVFQEAFGVNAHIRDVTERIAAEGFYAIAPELFHRTADKGFEGNYTDFETVRPHVQALTTPGLSDDIITTHKFMTRQSEVDAHRTGSIGFCLGGRVSFLASCLLPLKAAACFYGGDLAGMAGDRIKNIPCPLLLCWGGKDKRITKDMIDKNIQALDNAGKEYVNVVFSRADHAFFCDIRASYDPSSATEAWALVKAFWNVNI